LVPINCARRWFCIAVPTRLYKFRYAAQRWRKESVVLIEVHCVKALNEHPPPGNVLDNAMDNSVIGLMIVSVITLFGLAAFYIDFVKPRRKRS
jgi:hypothetical protein